MLLSGGEAMTFGEFRKTVQYLMADEISFVDTSGEEMDIDNLDDEELEDICVVKTHSNGGYLEITLN